MKPITLTVTIRLESDTIFGSGLSIPGGEDISILTDAAGYPYLRGSTFRGLLRESMTDLLAWTGKDPTLLDTLFGCPDWRGFAEGDPTRRLRVTDFTMVPNAYPIDQLTYLRTFTQIENGMSADTSLRSARCIRKGLAFVGKLVCAACDRELMEQAILCIRSVGTMRHRGFGAVSCSCELATEPQPCAVTGSGDYLCCRFRLETPLRVTDSRASYENSIATRSFIEGSMIRGYVCGQLAQDDPAFFAAHKKRLLCGTRFLNALPLCQGEAGIPSIRGYYEQKNDATQTITHILRVAEPPAKSKRAGLGSVCRMADGVLSYWSADIGSSQRIHLRDGETTLMFQNDYLCAGQEFEGYIYEPDAALRSRIAACLCGTFWLGAAQHTGYGQCRCTQICAVDKPACQQQAALADEPGTELYMLLLSPLALRNKRGEICGLSPALLGELLGVEVTQLDSATALTERGGYNRTWGCALPSLPLYDSGSLFAITTRTPASRAVLERLMREGIGLRRNEGFGQVLFLRDLPSTMSKQNQRDHQNEAALAAHVRLRHRKIEWLKANKHIFDSVSRSQAGNIQTALSRRDWENELRLFLQKNAQDRGARHGSKFEQVERFIQNLLDRPLSETLGVPCENSEKRALLVLLFDYARKEG